MRDYIPTYSDSLYADIQPSYTDSLMHHGIKGMHWGIRRFQNDDGSLTPAGKKRYSWNPITRYFQKKEDAKKAAYQAKLDAMSPKERQHYLTQKEINQKRLDYMDDFDNTPIGKKTKKAYQDAGDLKPDWNDEKGIKEHEKRFEKAEKAYYYSMGNYMVKRLSKEHGRDEVEAYANEQRYPKASTLEERFGEDLRYTHGW